MTRDAKRKIKILVIAGTAILIGHWIDVYLMVMPGTIGSSWNGFNLIEFGILAGYAGAFLFVVFTSLAKAPLIAKNHPLLKESYAHHI
jgi:hypothetical protein